MIMETNLGNSTPTEIGKLVAEYQALHKRQSNHGFFWRIFHGKENDARSVLMMQMEWCLKAVLGESTNLLNKAPIDYATSIYAKRDEAVVEAAFAEEGISKRACVSVDNFFGVGVKAKDNDGLRASLKDDLDATVNNHDVKIESKHDEPVLANESVRIN